MNELPDTWLTCKLGEVINYGATQKAEPDEIPDDAWVLELEDIEKDTSKILQRLTFKQRQSKSTKSRFVTGDILYGKLRPYLNKVVRADQDGYCTTEIIPIKPGELVEGSYLFHWLKTPTFIDYVTSVSHGLNMPRLGTDAGKQAPFVLAPLPEQKRIADKLDAVLARVDACRDRLDRIPDILKRFRQSVLAAATTGKLTEDWRKENVVSDEWPLKRVETIATKVGSGSTPKGGETSYKSEGVPLIRSMNVIFYGFKREGLAYLDADQAHDLRNVEVQANDVLLNITGASIGRVTVAPLDLNGARVNQHVCIIRPNEALLPKFLCWYFASPEMQSLIAGENYGVTRQALTKQQILDFEVPVPSVEEQQEIIRRVETLFTYADRIDVRYQAVHVHVEKLTPALLAKSFRGELVPQDPSDEPASMLLERIRSKQVSKEKPIKTLRKTPMAKYNTESVKVIIQQMPQNRFSFDELRNQVTTDYEALKDIVFALLAESEPVLRQVFDENVQAMRFEKA